MVMTAFGPYELPTVCLQLFYQVTAFHSGPLFVDVVIVTPVTPFSQ